MIFVLAATLVALGLALPSRLSHVLSGVAVLSVLLAPLVIFRSGEPQSGLGENAPVIYTYTLLVPAALAGELRRRRSLAVGSIAGLWVVYFAAGLAVWWPNSQSSWSGFLQLMIGALSLLFGALLTRRVHSAEVAIGHMRILLIGIVVISAVVATAQVAGLPINPMPVRLAGIMGWRVNGLTPHPNTLGKLITFTIVLISGTRALRRDLSAPWEIILALVVVVLTGGRAALVAAFAAGAVWLVGTGSRSVFRILSPLLMVLGGMIGYARLAARFSEDDSRDVLTEAALRALPEAMPFGSGPNTYVDFVSSFDTYTALSGQPVHNSFIYSLVELGPIGLGLIFLPALSVAFRASLRARRNLILTVSCLGFVFGLLVMGWTGWGLISPQVLPAMMFVTGCLWELLNIRPSERDLPVTLSRKERIIREATA